MKRFGLLALCALSLLCACKHPQPDYDAVRQRANQSQQDLSNQPDPGK